MAISERPRFISGVWGPYFSAMIPGMWLNEGGQSATGSLVDHIIKTHVRGLEAEKEAKEAGSTVYDILNKRLAVLSEGMPFMALLARDRHVLPYFHGNRSPRADPTLRGTVSGLSLSDDLDDLAMTYLATIQGIAHGTRHIVDMMNAQGYRIDTIFTCGGLAKNPVFIQEHANATGCRIALSKEPEAVLLGAAILGAVASDRFSSPVEAMGMMSHAGAVFNPGSGIEASYHDAKHRVFIRMYEDLMAYREIMAND
jgi:FGGY-family pentulose kinase